MIASDKGQRGIERKRFLRAYFILPFLLQGTLWWVVMKPLMTLLFGLQIKGYEHVRDVASPAIFAPNHSHPLDAELLPLALPLWSRFSPMFYVAREAGEYSSWKKLLFGIFNLEHIGAYALAHDKKDYAASLKKHVAILNDGGSVCIFPEGGITRDGLIRRAHGGVSYLANQTGLPVIPVLIRGSYRFPLIKLLFRRESLSIEFFPPVYIDQGIYRNSDETAEAYRANAEEILNILRKTRVNPK